MTEPLTPDEIERMRREHVMDSHEYVRPEYRGSLPDSCAACDDGWPCDAARLLAHFAPGPVPHLAEVQR